MRGSAARWGWASQCALLAHLESQRRLLGELFDRRQIGQPGLGGPRPNLAPWNERVSLAHCPGANRKHLRIVWSGRVDGRSALRTESLRSLCATLAGLHIDLRLPCEKPETISWSENVRAECRSRQRLAVCAMTNSDVLRVDRRLVGDEPAVASPVNLHDANPLPVVTVTPNARAESPPSGEARRSEFAATDGWACVHRSRATVDP